MKESFKKKLNTGNPSTKAFKLALFKNNAGL